MTILIALLGCDPAGTEPKDGALPCLGCDSAEDHGPDTDDTDTGGGDTDSGIDDTDSGDTDVNDTDSGDTDVDDTGAVAPPRVILFVGDGMGFPHVQGGGLYAYGSAGSLVMEGLPYAGRLVTASLTGVTDSAAGATALATGHKTWNGVIGMDRELVAIESVLAAARARGLAGGIVTTDAITGATPASFYAHVSSRGDREEIAGQLLADPPEVVLGGGGATLDALLPGHDVQVVNTRTELYAATRDERPFFGVFAEDTLPFVVDGYDDQPTIAEMTAYALDVLDDDPDGFFLVVEGARIDHASHGNDGDKVHQETAAFDEAVAAAVAWASAGGYDPTVLVTADHECGGLEVSGGGAPGVVPDSEWRWGQHTNADIPVFGAGPFAEAIDGQRLDNTWVHAVLDAAVSGAATLTAPAESPIVDGRTADLGAAVVTQTWETSFGVGYNQLDGLRIFADEDGLRAGVDGVFEFGENAVLLLFDMDYGAGTGLGADDTVLADTDGTMDAVLTAMPYTSGVAGMGFDLVFGSLGGEETLYADLSEVSGVRGLPGPWGASDDYWWLWGTSNFDDGNLADGAAARDAAGTGLTEHGWEVQLRWTDLYPSGLPSTGLSVAVVAVLANGEGAYASNQALPPLPAADEPGTSPVLLESAVLLEVDAAGVPRGAATIVP
jgi:alkaline phosphatase